MHEEVQVAVQIQTDRLHDSYQRENDEFLKTIDDNMKRIIKKQVKIAADLIEMELKKILIEKMEGNKSIQRSDEQRNLYKALVDTYEADKTILDSYGDTTILKRRLAADLIEMELKKILIEKMEGNKSIQRSDEQRNLYKALVDTYEADKTILDSYGDTTILKRRREDDDDQEGPSAGSDRGSKRRREGGEPESASTPSEPATRSASRSTIGTQYRQMSASESAFAEEPVQTTCQMEEPSHPVNPKGQQYPHNLLQPLSLIPDNRGRRVILFSHFINNDLEYLRGCASSRKYTTSVTKTKATDYGHIKWIEDLFYGFAVNRDSALDVYSKKRIITVTDLKIVKWHNYKHLDWISIRCDDDKIKKSKEGDFKRLRLQDIEDMLLRLVQGKLDGTLNDVRNALDDRLKGIRMQYLRQTIWRKGNEDRAAAMIQAIDKMLKTRRIMRSLERFVGGRLYEGDFRMLQRTI
nr:hypothetical protein [Tanacetum cinerariifolium]